jgi:ABC-type lipoprotein export system ATPase subunit
MAMIELEGIGRRYEKSRGQAVHALRDVTLAIDRGEFVAVVGRSGSGKSTLMNVLGLLDRPDAGRYRLDGRDTSSLSVREQARLRNAKIGFVFQSFHLLQRATALENVELPLVYSDRAALGDLGRRALGLVGLGDRLTHTPAELSGDQQQRVAIARALVNEPDVILADEPTGNLDAGSAAEILNILTELNRSGRTVILVTHDASVAARCARNIQIADGVIVHDAVTTETRVLEEVR